MVRGHRLRVRFVIDCAGTPDTLQAQLEAAETTTCSSGSYSAVPTDSSGHWQIVDSSYITDGEATTDNAGLTNPPATSFLAGEVKDAGNTTGSIALKNNQFTEVEYVLQTTSNATLGGTYCLRVYDANDSTPLTTYEQYAIALISTSTAVDLLAFGARGGDHQITVTWETGQEINNRGFNLYRSESLAGPYVKLNAKLIAAGSLSGEGRSYSFIDSGVTYATLYYYKLEDVDVTGTHTVHGPICVDWDADGMPDDWEIAHGLNPRVDDSLFDDDGDGLSNLKEHTRGSDPQNPDSDGDGVLDGDEVKDRSLIEEGRTNPIPGVDILASDDSGVTIELTTSGFDFEEWTVGGQTYERLTIPDYINGYTGRAGYPLLPLKGVLVDMPLDMTAELTILSTQSETHQGYQLYPVPAHEVLDGGQIREIFSYNQQGYDTKAFYPQVTAELDQRYIFRGSLKQKVVFYPLSFNPVTGDLVLRSRIRIRVDFVDSENRLAAASHSIKPWSPPAFANGFGGQARFAYGFGGQVRFDYDYTAPWLTFAKSHSGQTPRLPASFSGSLVGPLPSFVFSFAGLTPAPWTTPDSAANYKILVEDEGIYRITGDWLIGQGLSEAEVAAIDLSTAGMYYLGKAIAVRIHDDNGNDTLDGGDYIEFYGQPVAAIYSKYAKYNVYWLCAGGSASRMDTLDGTPASAAEAATHTTTVRHELDQLYLLSGRGADDIDRWVFSSVAFGDGIAHAEAGLAKDFTLELPAVAGNGTGDLTLHMYSPFDGAHSAAVAVNGTAVGTASWSGIGYYTATFEAVDLLDGDNIVSVTCTSGEDKIVFDWFTVTYQRGFSADSDTLRFTHETGYQYPVSGFTASEILAYDITDAAAVKQMVGGTVAGTNPYTYTFEPPDGAASHQYLLVTADEINIPYDLQAERPDMILASGENHADWIVITHKDLGWDINDEPQTWLSDLLDHRQNQGLRVMAVDVDRIYEAFSYGIVSPQAIKDFIAYAYENWRPPAPRYVLLVGDAAYDIKDNWAVGTVTHVPSYLIFTDYLGETATDQWYVQVAGSDALPDLSIGRLPARSAAEAADMANKIIAYELADNDKSWQRAVLLVADNQAEDFESVFETMGEDAAQRLPAAMDTPLRFYLQEYDQELLAVEDLTADLVAAVNTGALIFNYGGHSGYNLFASERIWDNRGFANREDCELLANTDKYFLIISMSCLAGYFIYPEAWTDLYSNNYHSIAEGFIRPAHNGAVAAIMPTGMCTTGGQHILNNAIFEEIFTNDERIIGDALLAARLTLLANTAREYQQISDTFLLFGDPATELKLPLPRRPQGLKADLIQEGGIRLSWQPATDCNGAAVAGYNLYRRAASESSFTRLNSSPLDALGFTDNGTNTSTLYYYAATSVDEDGDESVRSLAVTPAGASSLAKSDVSVVCFIESCSSKSFPNKIYLLLVLIAGTIIAGRRSHSRSNSV